MDDHLIPKEEPNLLDLELDQETFICVCQALDACRARREKDADTIYMYQQAFMFLEQQEWFQNHRHELTQHLKNNRYLQL